MRQYDLNNWTVQELKDYIVLLENELVKIERSEGFSNAYWNLNDEWKFANYILHKVKLA